MVCVRLGLLGGITLHRSASAIDRQRENEIYICITVTAFVNIFCFSVPVSLALCRRTEGGCLDLNKCTFFSPATLCNARCAQSALIRDFHLICE